MSFVANRGLKRPEGHTRVQGWRALFRGNGANVARSAPQKALDFFAFDALKDVISTRGGKSHARALRGGSTAPGSGAAPPAPLRPPTKDLGTMETLTAAGLAGAVSNAVLYPLEVVRTRLSADTAGVYRGMGHTFRLIVSQEGLPALYRCAWISWSHGTCGVHCSSFNVMHARHADVQR